MQFIELHRIKTFIKEYGGAFKVFEFKLSPKKKYKLPDDFKTSYPDHELNVVHPDNFMGELFEE